MTYAHDVLDVLDFFKCDDCYNPKAACLFLLEEMEEQGMDASDVLTQLNYQRWELIPATSLEEYITEYEAEIILDDMGLCGMVLVRMGA